MNRKVLISLLSLSLLFGCSNGDTNSDNTSNHSDEFTDTPSSDSSSIDTSSENEESSSGTSNNTSIDISASGSFSVEDATDALALALLVDQDFTEVRISQYNNYSNYRQSRSTKMNSYLDTTIYVGTTINRDANSYITASSNFREERTYKDSVYTQIRKFDTTFMATAYRYEIDDIEALFNLNIGQGYAAYLTLNTFLDNYSGNFFGEVLDDGSCHVTFIHTGDSDDQHYQFLAGFEFTLDPEHHVIDFWYSEGYYDTVWDNYDTVASMRKHGVYGEGYSYFMESYKLGEITDYPFALQFNEEDNFITEVSFSEESLTFSISETETDEYGYKSVNLLNLLLSNPQIGDMVRGCPINNLSFTSSNSNVIAINDGWYADFIGEGESTITVYDSTYGVTGSNTLTITLLP